MSGIDELIAKLCPEGVTFRPLGDCWIKNAGGGTPSKAVTRYWNGSIPWASVGDLSIPEAVIRETRNHITEEGLVNSTSNVVRAGDIIVAVKIAPGRMKVAGLDIAINQDLRGLTLANWLHVKFLLYFFQTLKIVGTGTIVRAITVAELGRIRIPVPPLEVQREIVRILDNFTELEAELEARRQQLLYFRGSILEFEPNVRWARVDEVCNVSRGKVISKDYLRDHAGVFPVYSSQTLSNGIFGYVDTFEYDFESVTWTTDGANAGSVFYHLGEKFSITNVCGLLKVRDPSLVSAKYLFHQLSQYAKAHVSAGMGNPKLMAKAMGAVRIPIPPLVAQDRAVSVLDQLDALVNDLSIGLPAELAARRKQYEYYRDRLLTFDESPA